jgi:hypothetical protein
MLVNEVGKSPAGSIHLPADVVDLQTDSRILSVLRYAKKDVSDKSTDWSN